MSSNIFDSVEFAPVPAEGSRIAFICGKGKRRQGIVVPKPKAQAKLPLICLRHDNEAEGHGMFKLAEIRSFTLVD